VKSRAHPLVPREGAVPRLARGHRRRHVAGCDAGFYADDRGPIGSYVLPSYTALATLVLNFAVAIVLTPVFNALGGARGIDETRVEHYSA
jgi:hypothetical protein